MTRAGAIVLCALLLAMSVFVNASTGGIHATVRLEEQSACRLPSGGYTLTFTLRTSYALAASPAPPVRLTGDRVKSATVVSDWGELVRFAIPGGGEAAQQRAPTREGTAPSGPAVHAIEGRTGVRLPLSTDASDWPGALLPGDYTIRFALEAVVVDDSGVSRGVEAIAQPLDIHVPDPTSAQECPFSLAPPNLLVAP